MEQTDVEVIYSKLQWRNLAVGSGYADLQSKFSRVGREDRGGGTFSKQVRHASGGLRPLLSPLLCPSHIVPPLPLYPLISRPYSIPSLPFLPTPFLSPSLVSPFKSRHPELRLGSLGERSSSPSGSGRSPAARRILTHFRPKFALFWVPNAVYWYTVHVTTTSSPTKDKPITRVNIKYRIQMKSNGLL